MMRFIILVWIYSIIYCPHVECRQAASDDRQLVDAPKTVTIGLGDRCSTGFSSNCVQSASCTYDDSVLPNTCQCLHKMKPTVDMTSCVPAKPINVTLAVDDTYMVSISWMPPPDPSLKNVKYFVDVLTYGHGHQNFTNLESAQNSMKYQSVPYKRLAIWVYAITLTGRRYILRTGVARARTPPAAPKMINFNMKNAHDDSYLKDVHEIIVSWMIPRKDITCSIAYFNYTLKTVGVGSRSGQIFTGYNKTHTVAGSYKRWVKTIVAKPHTTYILSMFAVSVNNDIGPTNTVSYHNGASYPPMYSANNTEPILFSGIATESTLTVTLNPTFFLNNYNGEIVDYGLVIGKSNYVNKGKASKLALVHGNTSYIEISDWKMSSPFKSYDPYRCSPLNWKIFKNNKESATYVIGTDGDCSGKPKFCNGKLLPGDYFSIKGFTCTSYGCMDSPYFGPFRTASAPGWKKNSWLLVIMMLAMKMSFIL